MRTITLSYKCKLRYIDKIDTKSVTLHHGAGGCHGTYIVVWSNRDREIKQSNLKIGFAYGHGVASFT